MTKRKIPEISIMDCCYRFSDFAELVDKYGNKTTCKSASLRQLSATLLLLAEALYHHRISLEKAYAFVKKRKFMLYDFGRGGVRVAFFPKKKEWICWCCGNLRVATISNDYQNDKPLKETGHATAMIFPVGLYTTPNRKCKHFNQKTRKCNLKKCVRKNANESFHMKKFKEAME